MPSKFTSPGPPPKEALDYFSAKGLKVGFNYTDVWKEEHSAAFTIAKVTEKDVLATARGITERALENGIEFKEFAEQLGPQLAKSGWADEGGGKPEVSRLFTIFQTNMRVARSAGQWERIERTKTVLPFLIYELGPSANHRKVHEGWAGTILPVDDPWWDDHAVPNGWLCFPAGTMVATSSSWRRIETLRPGDLVIGGSGELKPVVSIQPQKFEGEIVRLTVKQKCVSSTPNHRFLTHRGWIRADGLKVGDVLVQSIEAAGIDPPVGDVDNIDPGSGQLSMTIPRRQTSRAKAFYTERDGINEHVDPKSPDSVVVDAIESDRPDVVDHQRLDARGGDLRVRVLRWIGRVRSTFRNCHFGPNGWSSSRRRYGEFFAHLSDGLARLFGFSESTMQPVAGQSRGRLAHHFSAHLASSSVPVPLESNGFATAPDRNAESVEKTFDRPVIDAPHSGEIVERPFIIDVPEPEGFVDGAPLERFDSLDGFVAWSRSHAVLRVIDSIERVAFCGDVFDLSVADDQSYCIDMAIVHNCRCLIRQMGDAETNRLGGVTERPPSFDVPWQNPKTGALEFVPVGIDPGWNLNVGKNRMAGIERMLEERGRP